MAYHLILETSFLLDQRAMFSTVPVDEVPNLSPTDHRSPIGSCDSKNYCLEEASSRSDSSSAVSVPVPDGLHEEGFHNINLDLEMDRTQSEDDISTFLDSESITVLMSSQNASKGTICRQRDHFSCIQFYRNFDTPLGMFLRDNLLNQKIQCSECCETPEAHIYYYAHHSKQLTIQVKCLPPTNCLPREAEEKLWMWSRCGECKRNGKSGSTKRVLLSSAACDLSFGKFLERGLSKHSSFSRLPSCGHSLHRDFLYFFGLGRMVAMFRYSSIATYSVSMPPHNLQFSNSIRSELLKEEIMQVHEKGKFLFSEVEKSLQKIESQFTGTSLNRCGSLKDFSDIRELLKKETCQFENKVMKNGVSDEAIYEPLYLNRLLLEVVLESCLWEQRLSSLLSSDSTVIDAKPTQTEARENTSIDENTAALERHRDWIWTPFPDIRKEYTKELLVGCTTKLKPITSQTAETASTAYKLFTEEVSKLYIPLGIDDYVVSDYEDELSSIIACALGMLKDIPIPAEDLDDPTRKEKGLAGKLHERSPSLSRLSSLTSRRWSSISSWDSDVIHSSSSFSSDESHLSSFDGSSLLDSLVSLGVLHPEVSLGVDKLIGKTKYSVTCLYAGRFRDLRSQFCPSELDYIASLSRCRKWDAKGGKSKSFFAKTLDGRFIIKEIKRDEMDSFTRFAPDYFKYMNESIELGNQTCLAKILGIYQVTIRRAKSGKELKYDLMVMENLTFGRNIIRRYDLKGALYSRFNTAADGAGDALLDQNFVNDMNASPMFVKRKSKRHFERAVWNDTTFLNSINVTDYSLLVGVDMQSCELACGIVNYLKQYTWDKQFETWVMSLLLVPKNQLPTVISPKEYKKRFRKFTSKYFLSVPDRWCARRSSNPCKLCESGDDESKSNSKGNER